MSSATISTVVKMLESLPPSTQEQVAQHLREYIADMQEDKRWDEAFANKEPQLTAAARRENKKLRQGSRSLWMRGDCAERPQ